MIKVVLMNPEIPQNTGNIIRLCANSGAHIHLIEPLGFALDSTKMKRAGLDYREFVNIRVHSSWSNFLLTEKPDRWFALSTKGLRSYSEVSFGPCDYFIFGSESKGLPENILNSCPPGSKLRIPMQPNSRSLNLSNAVAIMVFEAWRQMNFINHY